MENIIVLVSDKKHITNYVTFNVDRFKKLVKYIYFKYNAIPTREQMRTCLIYSTRNYEVLEPLSKDFINSLPKNHTLINVLESNQNIITISFPSAVTVILETDLISQSNIDPNRPSSQVVITSDDSIKEKFPYEPTEIGIKFFSRHKRLVRELSYIDDGPEK